MKKKLQLKKEVVSILDRNSMQQMTKAGAQPSKRTCVHSDVCASTLCIYDTVNHDKCESRVCLETVRTGCDTFNNKCEIATQHLGCANISKITCLEETSLCAQSDFCALEVSVDIC